uniref:Uncharacterized protein n=1 Tax=viral metagenome TaxID=1070528 RepID=A0A6C0KVS5_9ZZZZ
MTSFKSESMYQIAPKEEESNMCCWFWNEKEYSLRDIQYSMDDGDHKIIFITKNSRDKTFTSNPINFSSKVLETGEEYSSSFKTSYDKKYHINLTFKTSQENDVQFIRGFIYKDNNERVVRSYKIERVIINGQSEYVGICWVL